MQNHQACLDVMPMAAIFYAKIHQFMMNSKLLKLFYFQWVLYFYIGLIN